MDLHALWNHAVDVGNRFGWLSVYGSIVSTIALVFMFVRHARDRGRLRLEAMVQGPHRSDWDETAMQGDGVTLTIYNEGTKPVAVSHVCGERVEEGFRMPFALHQHPRSEWRLEPGAMKTAWALDAKVLDRSVRWLGVADHLGHVWKLPRLKLWKLIRSEERARRNAMVALCRGAPEDVAH